jgi:hypothetical protein
MATTLSNSEPQRSFVGLAGARDGKAVLEVRAAVLRLPEKKGKTKRER